MMRARDLPAITPEDYELKEEGVFIEARDELMRGEGRYAGEQRRYLETMAQEMKLKVIRHIEFRKALAEMKKVGFEWGNGWIKRHLRQPKPRREVARIPRVRIPREPHITVAKKKAKRKRSHTQRTGKTMRVLRKIDGVKVFSFPDDVWGVKKPRKKRR